MRFHDLIETVTGSQTPIHIPSLWYRGAPCIWKRSTGMAGMSTSYFEGPVDTVPPEVEALKQEGIVGRVHQLSRQTPFKINRTYEGKSNWGFGVYFAANLDWARRYGDCITCVEIDPKQVLAIRADDFARRTPDTMGARLHDGLDEILGPDSAWRDQAPVFSKVVAKLQKGAKALYVETSPGNGQICVYSVSAIIPRFYFEISEQ